MRVGISQQQRQATLGWKAVLAGFIVAIAFTMAAAAAELAPTTPTSITPPVGNSLYLVGHAVGTQGYVCLPKEGGASWTVNGSRPEATLFVKIFGQDVQIITHFTSPVKNPHDAPNPLPFGSPTWQSSFDSSAVWAKALSPSVVAGTDASCPNAGSIPCLLLQSIGEAKGPSGGKVMTQTTYIQRLNTNGGAAPAEGCSTATDVSKQVLVPYTADYYFYRKSE